MRIRIFKVFGPLLLVIFAFVTICFLFLTIEHVRGKLSLAKYQKQLKAKGEPITADDLKLPADEGPNGASEVMSLSQHLIKGPILPLHTPPRMRMTPSGDAIIGFRRASWTDEKDMFTWDQLAADLETNRAVLDRIRASLAKPVLDNRLDYTGGPMMPLPQLMAAKNLTYWFASEAGLALHQNRAEEALKPLVAEINLPRFLERDRVVISELVRIALCAIARMDTWEALQADGWTDPQLLQLQNAWQQQHFLPNLTRSLEGESVFASTAFDMSRKSNDEAYSVISWSESMPWSNSSDRRELELRDLLGDNAAMFLKKQLYSRTWRFAWLDQSHRQYLHQLHQLIQISRDAEQSKSWNSAHARVDSLIDSSQIKRPYDRLRFPAGPTALGGVAGSINKAMRAETERSLAIAAIALKRYSLTNSTPPASLDALVPALLDSVPTDYMDGKPLKYKPATNATWLLYSVGEDGTDDGGDASLPDKNPSTTTSWARKDVVWPRGVMPQDQPVAKP